MKALITALAGLLFLAACSKENNPPAGDDRMAACLKKYNFEYGDIMTKADISKHVSIDEASYKREVGSRKDRYGHSTYEWNSDRPELSMEILGIPFTYPDLNRVELRYLYFYDTSDLSLYNQESILNLFDTEYKVLSEAELKTMRENLERQYANDPQGLETALKLLEGRANFNYKRVDGLGSRAYWNWHEEYGLELNVLAGSASFTLQARLSAEAETTLPIAVAIAKEILGKCN